MLNQIRLLSKIAMLATFLGLLALTAIPAFASAKPDQQQLKRLQKKMVAVYSSMVGVNGFGISNCVSETGEPSGPQTDHLDASAFELCSTIYTETREAEAALNTLLPPTTRISNIMVAVKFIGTVRPQ